MNKMRNLISILFGLLALAALAAGLAWLFGPQGVLPGQQVSPVRTPTPGLKETPTPMRYVEPTAPSEDWPTLTPPPTRVMPTRGTLVVKPSPTPVPIPTRPPLLLTPTPEGEPPDDLQSLYYVADTGADPELRVIGMDAQGRRWPESVIADEDVLGGMNLAGLYPSPDGKYLALELVSPRGGYCEVKVVERSSGRVWCPFDDPRRCWGAFWDWTPDNQLLFQPLDVQPEDVVPWGVMVVEPETGRYAQPSGLPTRRGGTSRVQNVSISPDGSRLAYSIVEVENGEEFSEIWTMRMDGGDKQLVHRVKGLTKALSWSPAGKQLLYVYQGKSGHLPTELRLLNADGSDERSLAANLPMPGERRYRPVWSPDGRRVAFVRLDDSTTFYNSSELWGNVYVVDTTTGEAIRLSAFEKRDVSYPTWSPDGRFVAFVSTTIVDEQDRYGEIWRYGEVWVASVDGSQLYAVSGAAKPYNALAWLPSTSAKEIEVKP